ncbi:tRNA preQ1(34) S-adenosylmethionine ribosyltransferase-isomerase QueA [Leptospira licerasiae]|uniref:S-adenosylmethionine:tRNA ribosyltransferase-isomerase n=1 Tax=Leptospira licerasiae str. MMD4847 TaxID=1049971 RepID=A0ABN0HDX0_9LEPT|nr:tRNA preQ1(34) S-adenosylmethionine ribosyltransferase-isomerase QueA [Leptospira licerasiae]EIE01264.1 S-adenosylmethionine:tRNA ribosyltransferase-isomerase [Leptospira licerasiae serovar Varillal str. VAR 010]EJZ43880.1 S-adenosylmethionine:tRNA ribosyltransferase-isomerase [Leptospira licerasiae str. MMD4847]
MEFQDLSDFDFELPEDQIAKFPAAKRDKSRLLVLGRTREFLKEETEFSKILNYLIEGDVLVANATRVSKRRVFLVTETGRRHEAMFLSETEPRVWKTLTRNSKKLKLGDTVSDEATGNFLFTVERKEEEFTFFRAEIQLDENSFELIGRTPIPPYFKRESTTEDDVRYQTVYSKNLGSVAAPTAGLHFTPELLEELKNRNIEFLKLELKVGYGTFQSLSEDHFTNKKLHEEEFDLPSQTAELLNLAKKNGKRIISVGTTTLRALESAYDPDTKTFRSGEGKTRLFLQPEDSILSCEGLITNFHLPKSSLLLLVSAFAEKEKILKAYEFAIARNFRFFSYGDSMLILDPEKFPPLLI